jgi:hypothetical protein
MSTALATLAGKLAERVGMDLFCDLHRIAITEARSWWFFERFV